MRRTGTGWKCPYCATQALKRLDAVLRHIEADHPYKAWQIRRAQGALAPYDHILTTLRKNVS